MSNIEGLKKSFIGFLSAKNSKLNKSLYIEYNNLLNNTNFVPFIPAKSRKLRTRFIYRFNKNL